MNTSRQGLHLKLSPVSDLLGWTWNEEDDHHSLPVRSAGRLTSLARYHASASQCQEHRPRSSNLDEIPATSTYPHFVGHPPWSRARHVGGRGVLRAAEETG